MGELHRNLIGGEWVGGEGVPNINPSDTNDVVGDYARATKADAEAAIAAAKAAFPKWSRSALLERHAVLRKAADEITARKEELGKLLSREEGKTLAAGIGETVPRRGAVRRQGGAAGMMQPDQQQCGQRDHDAQHGAHPGYERQAHLCSVRESIVEAFRQYP